jgi:hypothetical protein
MQGAISGDKLRARVKRLGITYAQAAERLGLSLDGLNKQMRGDHKVSRQTEIVLDYLEREFGGQIPPKPAPVTKSRQPRLAAP